MANFSLVESAHTGANGVVLDIVDDESKKMEVHSNYKWVAGPETWDSAKGSIDYEYDSTASEGSQITENQTSHQIIVFSGEKKDIILSQIS